MAAGPFQRGLLSWIQGWWHDRKGVRRVLTETSLRAPSERTDVYSQQSPTRDRRGYAVGRLDCRGWQDRPSDPTP